MENMGLGATQLNYSDTFPEIHKTDTTLVFNSIFLFFTEQGWGILSFRDFPQELIYMILVVSYWLQIASNYLPNRKYNHDFSDQSYNLKITLIFLQLEVIYKAVEAIYIDTNHVLLNVRDAIIHPEEYCMKNQLQLPTPINPRHCLYESKVYPKVFKRVADRLKTSPIVYLLLTSYVALGIVTYGPVMDYIMFVVMMYDKRLCLKTIYEYF